MFVDLPTHRLETAHINAERDMRLPTYPAIPRSTNNCYGSNHAGSRGQRAISRRA